jgi:hypothetical protein
MALDAWYKICGRFPLSPRGVVNQVHIQLHRGALAMAESLTVVRTMSR